MRYLRLVTIGICCLAAASCAKQFGTDGVEADEDRNTNAEAEVEDDFVPGVLTVEFSDEMAAAIEAGMSVRGILATKAEALSKAAGKVCVTSMERVFPDAGEWEPRHRKAGLHRWYRIFYNEDATTRTKAIDSFMELDGVLSITPVPKSEPASFFNDPFGSSQWHYRSPGPGSGSYVWGGDIDVEGVWANYTGGSRDVIVAVVDAGIDMSHPDLAGVCIPPSPEGSRNFVYDTPEYEITPANHGTHVAGTIAAINNNGRGVCGIAGGLDGKGGVRILSCQIFRDKDGESNTNGNSEAAIVWACDHGAVICNNSWGSKFSTENSARFAKKESYEALRIAIEYFNENAGTDLNGNQTGPMKGGLVLFSAGNDGWAYGWPGQLECVTAVGATNAMNHKSSYSNYGSWVDICAPGGDGNNTHGMVLSCLPDSNYGYMNGTSMACPHVSGVAALIVSYFGGTGFTADMLREKLLSGANPYKVSPTEQVGPIVDALGSFTYGSTIAPEPVKEPSLSAASNNVIFSWSIPADPDNKVAGYSLLVLSEERSAISDIRPDAIPADVLSSRVESYGARVGDSMTWTMSDLKFEKKYYGRIFAYDWSGNYSPASEIISTTTEKNREPVFDEVCDALVKVKAHDVVRFNISGHDPDGHTVEFTVNPGSKAVQFTKNGDNGVRISILGRDAAAGTYDCEVIATDQYGCSGVYRFKYQILENHAPVAVKTIDDTQFSSKGQSVEFDVREYFSDPDDETLLYHVSTAAVGIVNATVSNGILRISSIENGMTTVTVKATDNIGAYRELTFRTLVRESDRHLDLFPNPVTNGILNIRPDERTTIDITISAKSGAIVYEARDKEITPFDPAVIDLDGKTAGVYYVTIIEAGKKSTYSIVKL